MAIIFNITESAKLSAFNVLQEPIQMLLETEHEVFEKGSLLPKIFVMKTMDSFQEEFRSSTTMDGFKPTEDLQPAGLSDFAEGYGKVLRTQIWTNSFVVSKQSIEDNQSMTINPKGMQFIKSYGRSRELFGFAMLAGALAGNATFENKAFECKGMDTVDGTVDGVKQNYFHKEHQPLAGIVGGEVQSNMFYKAVDLTAATAAEAILDVIGQVESKMQNYKDYKGNPIVVEPSVLLVPNHHALKTAILVALKSAYTSQMGDNGVNLQYGKWEIILTPYLNDKVGFKEDDQAFIMLAPATNRENLGAVWMDRTPLEITSWVDNGSKANVWDGRARYGVGFVDFRAMAYVCTKATATYQGNCTAL